jgi:hypothetical protein
METENSCRRFCCHRQHTRHSPHSSSFYTDQLRGKPVLESAEALHRPVLHPPRGQTVEVLSLLVRLRPAPTISPGCRRRRRHRFRDLL